MSFRTRLLLLFTTAVAVSVAVVALAVLITTRRAFERVDEQRRQALVEQFRREFSRRRAEVARRVDGMAQAESVLRMAIEASRPTPDHSQYVAEAAALAAAHGVDLLEVVGPDGAIISSAQWPGRFGYKQDWLLQPVDWTSQGSFLKREELPDEAVLTLVAVRVVKAGDKKIYLAGGQKLGREFVDSLVLPVGMRVLLFDVSNPSGLDAQLGALVAEVKQHGREITRTITGDAGGETVEATPLTGRERELLGVLLVGSSRQELASLLRIIRGTALTVGGAGIMVGAILSYWAAARVTRPVQRLAEGARRVAGGDWTARVEVGSRDEIGELAAAFNHMTRQLIEQRERLLQAERVAAWRELARRLAHELKNPLFPLQITVENLKRAHEQNPEQFEEVFQESTATLLAELTNLRTIVNRFSDFAKMPPPRLEAVSVNDVVHRVGKLFQAQLASAGISATLDLDESIPAIEADPEQLARALQNLVLNALDAMQQGGSLTLRTRRRDGGIRLEVSDTGAGLTPEECERVFTPYYTSKQHGTGLGLAIVQSVVADHGGTIAVESEPRRGTTFRLDFVERHA